ncbi:hypothetical protein GCM10022384_33000 [Streptomyces marokkonensis]|uniref:HTH tetR-type domain-containing protein n=1 Tax=Streptomyces marokkonensis TaxID=324855 RepID=A0ABP7QFD2_9ACTN
MANRRADRTEAILQSTLELAGESGFAKLGIEAVAARAGVGKHTVYRRRPSRGMLFLDAVPSSNKQGLDHRDTGDAVADLREVMTRAADLLGRVPWGPLYFRLLVTQQPLTHDHIDRVLRAVFTGMRPSET